MMQTKRWLRWLFIFSLLLAAAALSQEVAAQTPTPSRIFLPLLIKSPGNGGGDGSCQSPNILQDSNFEGNHAPWLSNSPHWSTLIFISPVAYDGTRLAKLGGYDYANDKLSQTINLPNAQNSVRVSFYLRVSTYA